MERLRLEDMSDREVLLIINDLVGQGWVDPLDVADRIGLTGDKAKRAAQMRLSWLRRMGALEREHATDDHGNTLTNRNTGQPRYTQRYCLTDLGTQLANGDLRKAQQQALDRLDTGQMLTVARLLTERSGGEQLRLLKREWRYRTEYASR